MPKAGTAYIKVEGDFSEFRRQAAREGRGLSRTVKIKADVRSARSSVNNLGRAFDDTSKRITVTERRTRSFGKGVAGLNAQMALLRNVFRVIKWPAIVAGFGTAAEGASAAAAGVVALTSALAPLSGLLATIPTGLVAFGQGLGTIKLATFGLSQALADMEKQTAASGNNAMAAAKQHQDSARTIADAERSLVDSHRSVTSAEQDLNAARKEATRTLVDLKFASEESALSEKHAALDLRAARNEERRVTRDQTSTFNDRREAALAVQDAELALRESHSENTRSQEDLNKAEKQGVEGAPGVVAAKRSIADAERSSADATRQLARAQEDAAQAMDDATSQAKTLNQQMATLPPATREFAKFLFDLKPRLDDLRQTAAAGLFPGVEKGIDAALDNFPELKHVIDETAKSFGGIAERAGEWAGSDGVGRAITKIGDANVKRFDKLSEAGFDFADALLIIMKAADPLSDFLVRATRVFARWTLEETKAGRKTGDLNKFFEQTKDVTQQLLDISTDLLGFFHDVGIAAAPSGRTLLDDLVEGADNLREWADSQTGRNSLKAYFNDARPAIEEFGRLISDFTEDFFGLAQSQGLTPFIHVLRVDLLPLIFEITEQLTNTFGPELVKLIVELARVMREVGTPALTAFVTTVTGALSIVNDLFEKIPGLANVAAAAFAGFSLIRLLGLTSLTRGGAVGKLIKGAGVGLAEAFGADVTSPAAREAWSNAGNLIKGRLQASMKYAVGGALAAVGFATILGNVVDSDWAGAAESAGGAIAGAIVGGIAGGVPGALAGAGIGALIGDQIEDIFNAAVDAVETGNRKLGGFEDALVELNTRGVKGLKELVAHLRGTDEAINTHLIQQWVAAGDVTLEQAGIMINALRNVNQEAARVSRETAERSGIGLGQQIAADGKITRKELSDTFDQLQAFKPKARDAALDAMASWLGTLKNMGQLTGDQFDQFLNVAQSRFGKIDTTIKSHSDGIKNSLQDFRQQLGFTSDDVSKNTKMMAGSFANLNRGISSSVDSAATAVFAGFKNISENTLSSLNALDVKKQPHFHLKAPVAQVGKAIGSQFPVNQATGGLVPGVGNRDTVPLHVGGMHLANVMPGEFVSVANKTATERLMDYNFRHPPAFAEGGTIAKLAAGGWLGSIGGVQVDKRIIDDAAALQKKYKLAFSAGYAPNPSVHAADGEHPLGLALDIVPSLTGSWDLIDQLAHYAEPSQNNPIDPWRWVGYDGDAGHGRGNHLHLSWDHTGGLPPPVPSVETMHGNLKALGAAIERIKRQQLIGPNGAVKDTSQAAIDLVTKRANEFVNSMSGPTTGEIGGLGIPAQVYHGKLDRVFPHPTSLAAPGLTISPEDSIGLARAAGFGKAGTRRTPEQQDVIVSRESQRAPGIVSTDGGFGLNQMTPRTWGSELRDRIESIGSYFNPVDNYRMAALLDSVSVGDPWTASAMNGGVIAKLAKGGLLRPIGNDFGPSRTARGIISNMRHGDFDQFADNLHSWNHLPKDVRKALGDDLWRSIPSHKGLRMTRSNMVKITGVSPLGHLDQSPAKMGEGGIINLAKLAARIGATDDPHSRHQVLQAATQQIDKRTKVPYVSQDGSALAGNLKDLRKKATDQMDNASSAADLEDASGGLAMEYGGKSQVEWLQGALETLAPLRNHLVLAFKDTFSRSKMVNHLLRMVNGPHGLMRQIQQRIDAIQKIQTELSDQRTQVEKELKNATTNKEASAARIKARLDHELRKPDSKRDEGLIELLQHQLRDGTTEKKSIQEIIGYYTDKKHTANKKLANQLSLRSAMSGPITTELNNRDTILTDGTSTLRDALDTVQGTNNSDPNFHQVVKDLPWFEFKGDIWNVQRDLQDLGVGPYPIAADTGFSEDLLNARLSAAEQSQTEALRDMAIAESQVAIFRRFFQRVPFGGSFSEGGVVPGPSGAPRVIVAHGGETVHTEGDSQTPIVALTFMPGAGVDPSKIRAEVNGVLMELANRADPAGGTAGLKTRLTRRRSQ